MRLLLLFSALLTAMAGLGAGVRPAHAQSYQAMALIGVSAPKVAEAAQSRRPVTTFPTIADNVAPLSQPLQVAPIASTPAYLERLRV